MIKVSKIVVASVVLALTVGAGSSSCRRSDLQRSDAPGQIDLRVSRSVWAVDSSADTPVSKVTQEGFQTNDQIGVYVHKLHTIGRLSLHSLNMSYAISSNVWRPQTPVTESLTANQYWVTAYYPYKPVITNITKVEHSVALDQSAPEAATASALERSDFCLTVAAAELKEINSESPKADLIFYHIMSKLRIDIDVPPTINGAQVAKLQGVALRNLYVGCTINLETQEVTPTGQGTNKVIPRWLEGTGLPATLSSYEAILVPHKLAEGLVFVQMEFIMKDGSVEVLEYKIPSEQTFELLKGQESTLSLSATAQLAFLSELDLLDGLAKTNLPLSIKVPKGKAWTLSSSATWLKLKAATSDPTATASISGVGTGSKQTVYVTVNANSQNNMSLNNIRAAVLTLTSRLNLIDTAVEYTATQNYTAFNPTTTRLVLPITQHTVVLPAFSSNMHWYVQSDQPWLKLATDATYGSGTPSVRYPATGYFVGPLEADKLWLQAEANVGTPRNATLKFYAYYDGKTSFVNSSRVVFQDNTTGYYPDSLPGITPAVYVRSEDQSGSTRMNWAAATASCSAPWRLPTLDEAKVMMANKSKYGTVFSSWYWTSTSPDGVNTEAYYITPGGAVTAEIKTGTNYVRCVK